MSGSRRLRQLKMRVDEIEKHFMPPIRVGGNYSRLEGDQMRAYRLLVHAEVESFLEDRAIEVLKKALDRYTATKKTGRPLVSVLTFTELASQGVPKKTSSPHDSCIVRLNRAFSHYRNWTQHHNHGIKEKNVLSLLLPVGLEIADIDTTLLNTLDSYGAGRGAVAHSSGKTQQAIDPATEKATVTLIIQELEKLDAQLQTLK